MFHHKSWLSLQFLLILEVLHSLQKNVLSVLGFTLIRRKVKQSDVHFSKCFKANVSRFLALREVVYKF